MHNSSNMLSGIGLLLLFLHVTSVAGLQPGFFGVKLAIGQTAHFAKRLSKGAELKLGADRSCSDESVQIDVKWDVVGIDCFARKDSLLDAVHWFHSSSSNAETVRFISNHNESKHHQNSSECFTHTLTTDSKWRNIGYLPLLIPEKGSHTPEPFDDGLPQLRKIATIPERGSYLVTLHAEGDVRHSSDGVRLAFVASNPAGCLSPDEMPLLYAHLSLLALVSFCVLALMLGSLSKCDEDAPVRLLVVLVLCFLLVFHVVSFATFRNVNHCERSSYALEMTALVVDDVAKTLVRFILLFLFGSVMEKHCSELAKTALVSAVYMAAQLSYTLVTNLVSNLALTQAMLFVSIMAELWVSYCIFSAVLSAKTGVFTVISDINLPKTLRVAKMAGFVMLVSTVAAACAGLDLCHSGWFLSWFLPTLRYSLRFAMLALIGVIYRSKGESYKNGILFFS